MQAQIEKTRHNNKHCFAWLFYQETTWKILFLDNFEFGTTIQLPSCGSIIGCNGLFKTIPFIGEPFCMYSPSDQELYHSPGPLF